MGVEKFLPDSRFRVKTAVLDLQKSYYPAYIFKNEFFCFNPIIFDSEKDYRTVTLGRKNSNTEEDSVYALFSSNKIYPFRSYDVSNTQKTFVAFEENLYLPFLNFLDGTFFVATNTVQGELRVIAYGTHPHDLTEIDFSDFLDCILKAHNLNCVRTFYFRVFDLYDKYRKYLSKIRCWVFVLDIFHRDYPWASWPAKILDTMFRLVLLYIGYFPIYHALILPFYILSLPFEIFLFEYHFVISGSITKNFMIFWTIPLLFNFLSYLLYFELAVTIDDCRLMQIKPEKINQAVPYFLGKKKLSPGASIKIKIFQFLFMLVVGFIYALPFYPFFKIIPGETNE